VDDLDNNAVVRPMCGPDADLQAWEESMKVSRTGAYLMHRHFGKIMIRQGSVSIVNIGLMMGIVGPSPALYEGTDMGLPPPDYFFHKGGMMNLTRYYVSIYGADGGRVNCLSPDVFLTTSRNHFWNIMTSRHASEAWEMTPILVVRWFFS